MCFHAGGSWLWDPSCSMVPLLFIICQPNNEAKIATWVVLHFSLSVTLRELGGRHKRKHKYSSVVSFLFFQFWRGDCGVMLRIWKGPVAWRAAAWTDGRSSSDVQGEAPAEWMNHRSTNCSPPSMLYRIRLAQSLLSWTRQKCCAMMDKSSDDLTMKRC